jgi:hypothetical protein
MAVLTETTVKLPQDFLREEFSDLEDTPLGRHRLYRSNSTLSITSNPSSMQKQSSMSQPNNSSYSWFEPFSSLRQGLKGSMHTSSSSSSYQIRHGMAPLIKLSLNGPPFVVGQDVTGLIELQTQNQPQAQSHLFIKQMKITLESQEEIDFKYAHTHRNRSSSNHHSTSHREAISSVEFFALSTDITPLSLHCPPTASPSFQTTLASVSYHLHLQFFISKKSPWNQTGPLPSSVENERFSNAPLLFSTTTSTSILDPTLEFYECYVPIHLTPSFYFPDLSLHHGHDKRPGLYQWNLLL